MLRAVRGAKASGGGGVWKGLCRWIESSQVTVRAGVGEQGPRQGEGKPGVAASSLTKGWKPRGQHWEVRLARTLDAELRGTGHIGEWGDDMVRAVSGRQWLGGYLAVQDSIFWSDF